MSRCHHVKGGRTQSEVIVLHFKLGPTRDVLPEENDELGRSWIGYEPGLSEQTVYEQNRGRWRLGSRAAQERYAMFSDIAEKRGRAVIEISGIEKLPTKSAVVGTVLSPGHPVHDAVVGRPAPDNFRNPVTYVADPGSHEPLCGCGCGEPVTRPRQFTPGHDQRAVHARITAQWGSTLGFINWYDQKYGTPA
jgi:hypothetical protein